MGKAVGNYRIEALLGQGGMGAVFLAVHQQIGKRAAVKILAPELGYHLLEVEDNRVVVHTRQRREPDGAWEPDYCWRKGKDKSATLVLQPYRNP